MSGQVIFQVHVQPCVDMLQVFSRSAYTPYIAAANVYSLALPCLLLLVYQFQLYDHCHVVLPLWGIMLSIPYPRLVVPHWQACGGPA